jgi:hypothetical protein
VAIEIDANNPLGVTIAGPGYGNPNGAPSYGATGTVTSGLGYTFDVFPNQQAGIAAGETYISNQIASGKATTLSGLANLFGGASSLGPLEQVTGLGPNSAIDTSQSGILAAGIAAGEGTLSAFGGVSAFTGNSGTSSPSVSAATPGAAGAGSSGGNPVTNFFSGLETWIANATGSVVWVIVGVVLLGGALLIFADNESGGDLGEAIKASAAKAVT